MTEYVFAETGGAARAPLIFTFHGTGGDEQQFHAFASQIRPDAHVISPRGNVLEHGMNRFFARKAEGVYDMDDLAFRTDQMAQFVSAQKARVGAERVCALGYSNGANIAAAVALKYPELFTDLALLHPLIPWEPEPQPGLKGCNILISAGERDPICPMPQTKRLLTYLNSQGADVTEVWHPGGHEIAQTEIDAVVKFLRD